MIGAAAVTLTMTVCWSIAAATSDDSDLWARCWPGRRSSTGSRDSSPCGIGRRPDSPGSGRPRALRSGGVNEPVHLDDRELPGTVVGGAARGADGARLELRGAGKHTHAFGT